MFWGCFPKINTKLFSLNNDDGNVFILNVFNLIGKTVDSSWGRGNRFGLNAVISCDINVHINSTTSVREIQSADCMDLGLI